MPIDWRDYNRVTHGLGKRARELIYGLPKPPTEIEVPNNCRKSPIERQDHTAKVVADDCTGGEYPRWCDVCGRQPVAVYPLFNRFAHTARLCEFCLAAGITKLAELPV